MGVYAADGIIFFTDLEQAVGDVYTVTGSIKSHNGNLGEVSLEMTYDTNYVQFISGDEGVTMEEKGKLTFQGTGESDMLQFEMEFQAIQEGEMRMTLDTATVVTESGVSLDCQLGYSNVIISEGDPSKIISTEEGPEVNVDGVTYNLSEGFADADVPNGFSRSTITYEGESYEGAAQDGGDMTLAYLVDENSQGSFFVYSSDTSAFSGFEQVIISENSYIILLQEDDNLTMSDQYSKVDLTFNGKKFPAWQDTENKDYYLLYALNNEGVKTVYRYDSVDSTYQRFVEANTDTGEVEVKNNDEGTSLFGKVSDYLKKHIDQFLIGAGMLMVLCLIFIIILGVKLHNRNAELDELYDELDEAELDTDEEVESLLSEARREPAIRRLVADEGIHEDFPELADDFENQEFTDKYEDEFDEDEFDEDYDDDEFDAAYEDEEFEEPQAVKYDEYESLDLDQTADLMPAVQELDIQEDDSPVSKPLKHTDFNIEFIDLD